LNPGCRLAKGREAEGLPLFFGPARGQILRLGIGIVLPLFFIGCAAPEQPEHLKAPAADTGRLGEGDYLKRRATLGSRAERAEALSVIELSGDPEYLPFLLLRLEKEDDEFLQVHILRILARSRDFSILEPLRQTAWNSKTRAAIVAAEVLYSLGDDCGVPRLVDFMSQPQQYGNLAYLAHQALERIYGLSLPPTPRTWLLLQHARRMPASPCRVDLDFPAWMVPLTSQPPSPPTPPAPPPPTRTDSRRRLFVVSFQDFWRADQP
jgi:hypothetical protein